ncbi:winged helix DNA-binding domain-containing protein [Anaerotalea alkaliphila]|uniref:Winged helix DNA-binding domain-containing protein n=1 Tax=Anaerotalea alkaliphila TaxID=2662126 RepID=A0A7X5KL31_9FIRM|nr:winged helix DNA-binding domain-containing protein [Anaerotalea alkaliphila]NDL66406.1 winged helix DNA-binding domain-containing protein [Anaerotalea alkaliphila]
MTEMKVQNIRLFRLHAHHLDVRRKKGCIPEIAGACGMQNTPPGAWETSLFNRVSDCSLSDMKALLFPEKSLLQAWSFRGAPVVFPVGESDAFLTALVPRDGEDWIYTQGIAGALDFLQMPFGELLDKLKQVMPLLDDRTIESKSGLDRTMAEWMLPLLPMEKRDLWNSPSLYGTPDRQTVGGAVVSFLLRPCAFLGLVVFGERAGASPAFTSYKGWLGHPLDPGEDAAGKLVRKFLHCYGPATADAFASWLGCSVKQARRMWESVSDEMEPVETCGGKKAFVLSADKDLLRSPPSVQRELLLLGGHDPYLDQRDRHILLDDKALQKKVWQTAANPGVILQRGEIIGIWAGKRKGAGIEIKMTLWDDASASKQKLQDLAEEYVAFRQQKLLKMEL